MLRRMGVSSVNDGGSTKVGKRSQNREVRAVEALRLDATLIADNLILMGDRGRFPYREIVFTRRLQTR